MTKEALRLALEVLKAAYVPADLDKQREKAITCLRFLIDAENISSKPMAWEQFYPEMGKPKLVEVQDGKCKYCTDGCPACDARKLPEQEPAAWFSTLPDGRLSIKIVGKPTEGNWEPLYATPPQRTWVGLTDEEIKEIVGPYGDTPIKGYTRQLFDKIEAKLKEKNNG